MIKNKKKSQQQLELLIDSIDGVVWGFDLESRKYTFISHQFDFLLPGLRLEALDNANLFYEHVHPDDRNRYRSEFLEKVLLPESFQLEYRLLTPDNDEIHIRDVITPVQEFGATTYVTGIMFDVTRYKRATLEKNKLEVQLRHAQKLEAVGQLAAGIAHEINTPIQFVGDNIHFLQGALSDLQSLLSKFEAFAQQVPENDQLSPLKADIDTLKKDIGFDFLIEDINDAISQSMEGTQRVASIVKAMKSFSHPGSSEKEAIDLNHAIESTITVARNEWKYVAKLETDFDPDLPYIFCFPDEINQTFLNLIVNAAHAIEDKQKSTGNSEMGEIRISTKNTDNSVIITVSDTGCGIPESHIEKIYDPFFTTKEVGKGTGQGLSIAHSVITDKHGGSLVVDSKPGQGTNFTISLPVK